MSKSKKNIDLYGCLPYPDQAFRDAWTEWINYRIERGNPYKTQIGVNRQLKEFSKNKLTSEQAIECIEYAIDAQWIKAFALKFYKNGTSSRTTIADSLDATEQAFANLQRNIDQAMRPTGTENWGY